MRELIIHATIIRVRAARERCARSAVDIRARRWLEMSMRHAREIAQRMRVLQNAMPRDSARTTAFMR